MFCCTSLTVYAVPFTFAPLFLTCIFYRVVLSPRVRSPPCWGHKGRGRGRRLLPSVFCERVPGRGRWVQSPVQDITERYTLFTHILIFSLCYLHNLLSLYLYLSLALSFPHQHIQPHYLCSGARYRRPSRGRVA
jgi:hypothetical protein